MGSISDFEERDMKHAEARAKLAFALDVPTLAQARGLIEQVAPCVGVFKVGLELFMAEGSRAVDLVRQAKAECFLDLKLHDISETVARSVKVAVGLGVRYLTVHAANGPHALKRAAEAARDSELNLLAVTLLTSLDASAVEAIGFNGSAQQTVSRFAQMAFDAGLRGIVTSSEEVSMLRAQLGPEAFLVVPGIRPEGADQGDQKRVMTPAMAIGAGADLLVVGRPIRDAAEPRLAAEQILEEISQALQAKTDVV